MTLCAKPAIILKVTLLHGCFSCFLNCANGTKSSKASHIDLKEILISGGNMAHVLVEEHGR